MTKTLNVLILEDSEDDALLEISELKIAGYNPSYKIIDSPKAFEDELQNNDCQLILADFTMPHLDVFKAMDILKTSGQIIPFIVVSGTISVDVAVEIMKMGATDYILKDNMERIGIVVVKALEMSHLKKEQRFSAERLRESEETIRALINASEDVILLCDINGVVLEANETLAKRIAIDISDLMGKNLSELFPNDIIDNWKALIKQVVDTHSLVRLEHERNGSWNDTVFYPVFDDQCKIQKIAVSSRDITEQKMAEKIIREREERYKALYTNAPLSYQSLDVDAIFMDVNPAWLQTLGYDRKNVIGKRFSDFLHPDFIDKFENRYSEFKRKGFAHDIHFKIRHKDGNFLDIAFEGRVGSFPDGTFKETYSVFQDITTRMMVENFIRLQRDLAVGLSMKTDLIETLIFGLDAILNSSSFDCGGIYLFDSKTGDLEFKCHRGLSDAFVRSVHRYEYDSPNVKLINAGKPIFLDYSNIELDLSKVEKEEGIKSIAIFPIVTAGSVLGAINVATKKTFGISDHEKDIIQAVASQIGQRIINIRSSEELERHRKDLEGLVNVRTRQIMVANELNENIISTVPSAIIVMNDQFVINSVNKRFFEIFGVEDKNVMGFNYFSVIGCKKDDDNSGSFESETMKQLRLLYEGDLDFVSFEESIKLDAFDEPKTFRGYLSRITKEDKEQLLLAIEDITLAKILEGQLVQSEQLAATGRLAASIAHEINNPLQGMLTHLDLMRSGLPDDSTKVKNYDHVKTNISRIRDIVGQLLDSYRGSSKLKTQLNINDLIKGVVSLVDKQVKLKDISLVLDLDINIPDIPGQKQQLHQVFLNLILNAYESMDGLGAITIATSFNDTMLRIMVKDTGNGIQKNAIAHLFDPFFSTKTDQGVGLGLFVCQGIVKDHKGEIEVASKEGQGAEFTVTLPVSS